MRLSAPVAARARRCGDRATVSASTDRRSGRLPRMILHLREREKAGTEVIARSSRCSTSARARLSARTSGAARRHRRLPAEHSETALRVTLFDDEVDSLMLFDPLTGGRPRVSRFTVYPSSHYVTPRATTLRAIEAIKLELAERRVLPGRASSSRRSGSSSARASTSRCERDGFCKGIENYSRICRTQAGEPADAHRLLRRARS